LDKRELKNVADSGAAVGGMKQNITVYSLFSLQARGAKKKAKQKRNAVRRFRSLPRRRDANSPSARTLTVLTISS